MVEKNGGNIRFVRYLLSVSVVAALLYSCGISHPPEDTADKYEIDRNFTRGPVDFRVAVSKKEITIADNVKLLLETKARDKYMAELPSFGDKLQQFGIVDYRTFEPELGKGDEVITKRVYKLQPFLSGEYKIPPMVVEFHSERDTARHYIRSDTITVKVNSLLPENKSSLEIKDIAGPRELPREFPWTPALAGIILIAAILSVVVFRLRKKKTRAVPPPAAHEVALAKLQNLLGRKLAEKKLYREFTIEVSDILRGYIEDRFGLKAPERTTEEFLAEAGSALEVDKEKKEMIKQFLFHCDMVKFALLQPTQEDVRKTFDFCRDFIDATKIKEEVKREAA
ncbi:MAG: hypothetical protein U5O15_00385 [Candidatus Krumholzibacteriota bacterium]|nr:hypothetical protein [Candidatus Krumholzibacteriota bacterium]